MTLSSDPFEVSNRLLFEAIRTDTNVGLTFCALASEADEGSERRIRNQMNARKAYDTVLSVGKKTSLSGAERQELAAGLDKLKTALEALGEHFQDDGGD